MRVIGICLALGDIYQDKGKGELVRPTDGAVARFEAVTRQIEELEAEHRRVAPFLVCTAGYCKSDPHVPAPEREASLAEQLGRYVNDHSPKWNRFLHVRPLCWGTEHEIMEGIDLAIQSRFVKEFEEALVIIASNRMHLLRVRLYAYIHLPYKWKLRLVVATHPFGLRGHILEFVKLGRDLWRLRKSFF